VDRNAHIIRKVDYGEAVEGVNKKHEILDLYLLRIVPSITQPGIADPTQEGSCIEKDKDCLDRIARRVYFGDYVALAKLQERPEIFIPMIRESKWEDIRKALRDERQEEVVVQRVAAKCDMMGLDKTLGSTISRLWNTGIMPLTLTVEVDYFKYNRKEILVHYAAN
jgi:chorismate mutase